MIWVTFKCDLCGAVSRHERNADLNGAWWATALTKGRSSYSHPDYADLCIECEEAIAQARKDLAEAVVAARKGINNV